MIDQYTGKKIFSPLDFTNIESVIKHYDNELARISLEYEKKREEVTRQSEISIAAVRAIGEAFSSQIHQRSHADSLQSLNHRDPVLRVESNTFQNYLLLLRKFLARRPK